MFFEVMAVICFYLHLSRPSFPEMNRKLLPYNRQTYLVGLQSLFQEFSTNFGKILSNNEHKSN